MIARFTDPLAPYRTYAALLLLIACGSSPSGTFEDPLSYLSFERDRGEEARSIHARFEARGLTAMTLAGETFHVVAARGETSAVRVITSRGIAFALDAPSDRHTAEAVTLLSLDGGRGHDVDLDGHEEVALALSDDERRCLLFVRVLADGATQAVPLDLADRHAEPCVLALEDVTGDARVEAIVALRFPGFAIPTEVVAPFSLGATWRLQTRAPRFFTLEREKRVRARDAEQALRHAIELALIAQLEGAPFDEQLAAFNARVQASAHSLDPGQVREARAVIELQRAVSAAPEDRNDLPASDASGTDHGDPSRLRASPASAPR